MAQDDFSNGVGTYLVKFKAMPAVKMADIKKEIGKFKIEKTVFKITGKVVEKTAKDVKTYSCGTFALTDSSSDSEDSIAKLAEFLKAKKSVLVLTGILNEDDKGKQTIELTKVDEMAKK